LPAILKSILSAFTSLWLAIICLGFAMLLTFVGTLEQVNLGIHAVQKKYFESFLVFWAVPGTGWSVPVLPGGFLIGTLLLLNLIGAHLKAFRLSWRKSGIVILHSGLILLLLGMLFTSLFQVESQMILDEMETKNYSEHQDRTELAIIDTSPSENDFVVSIPQELVLEKKQGIQHPKLPFRVNIREAYPNSSVKMAPQGATGKNLATQGLGPQLEAAPLPITYKLNEQNIPTAFVELEGTGGSLGIWLVSKHIGRSEQITHEGRTFEIQLRPQRFYKPYSVQLLDFAHDKYPGTEIPRNFSSKVKIYHPAKHDDREVLIYMNNPLRYEGETYYQASFANNDRTSILQVVRNPSWQIPYISCVLVSLGMIVQFSIHLFEFLKKRRAS
jgi:hypothetical protein